jgi:ectoine utilization protein EutD
MSGHDFPAFSIDEYQARLARVRTRMQAGGLDALITTNPANMGYLTGYDGWSFYVHQCVIVALALDEPIWVGRGMDANAARVTTWLSDNSIVGYPDDYVQSLERHPMDFVADLMKSRSIGAGNIGVEKDGYYFTAGSMEHLLAGLPYASFHDTTKLIAWVKCVKSEAELAMMRDAARIIEKTMAVAIDMVRPGVRQCDAAAAILKAQVEGHADAGGDYPAIMPMLPSGVGTSTPHLTWTDAPFRTGEATILELAGVRRRYHCPMARTVHLGPPPARLADTAKVVVEGLNTAIAAARPGVACEEVEAAWRAVISRHGIVKDSRMGYSCGLAYPPDWGEGTLSLRPGDRTELEPGMTIHVMPGVWLDDWGIEISECVHITPDGARRLCNFPQPLIVK